MLIREASVADLKDVLQVELEAFNSNVEPELVKSILDDPTAKPTLSLLSYIEGQAIGHILFSKAKIQNASAIKTMLLAPLAVTPKYQKQGIGGSLIIKGLQLLTQSGVDLVFVLGHPQYYPKYGFTPAGKHGFEAPYPIAEKNADAWMMQALKPDIIGKITGKVICCNALDKPEYWRE